MPPLKHNILASIKEKKIRPRPRWQYVALHALLTISVIWSVIVGSFAFALFLFEFSLPERPYVDLVMDKKPLAIYLPYIWAVCMLVAIVVGYVLFSRTGKNYKFHTLLMVGILLVGSLIGWYGLYISRAVHWWDEQLRHFDPRYRDIRESIIREIPSPESGVLPLRIDNIEKENIYWTDPRGQKWQVILSCQTEECTSAFNSHDKNRPIVFEWAVEESDTSDKNIFRATDIKEPMKNMRPKNFPSSPERSQ